MNPPGVLTHRPPEHNEGCKAHSSMSRQLLPSVFAKPFSHSQSKSAQSLQGLPQATPSPEQQRSDFNVSPGKSLSQEFPLFRVQHEALRASTQTRPDASRTEPASHSQTKLPGALTHRPLTQTFSPASHSSSSSQRFVTSLKTVPAGQMHLNPPGVLRH